MAHTSAATEWGCVKVSSKVVRWVRELFYNCQLFLRNNVFIFADSKVRKI